MMPITHIFYDDGSLSISYDDKKTGVCVGKGGSGEEEHLNYNGTN